LISNLLSQEANLPLKLNVGLAKKVGLPRYGSVGATCQVEIELSGGLLYNDPPAFQRHVRAAYDACRQAVEVELAQQSDRARAGQSASDNDGGRRDARRLHGNVEVHSSRTRDPAADAPSQRIAHGDKDQSTDDVATAEVSHATQKQHAYIRRLAGQIRGVGLRRIEPICQRMFGKPLGELNSLDASSLIDALKALKQGDMDVETALQGAAA
jgi:hypothetical protein